MTDIPWPDAGHIYFTDGSSFIQNRTRFVGEAVVDLDSVIWVTSLPPETSAQKVERKALSQALKLVKGATANIYTDGRYAFAMAHVHRSIH